LTCNNWDYIIINLLKTLKFGRNNCRVGITTANLECEIWQR